VSFAQRLISVADAVPMESGSIVGCGRLPCATLSDLERVDYLPFRATTTGPAQEKRHAANSIIPRQSQFRRSEFHWPGCRGAAVVSSVFLDTQAKF